MKYVSVTEALSVLDLYSGVPAHVLGAASELGTEVHRHCLAYAAGLPPVLIPDDVRPFFDVFREWFDENVIEVMDVEIEVIDKGLQLIGHIDMICKLKGERTFSVVDIKRVETVFKSVGLQLAAYKYLAEKQFKRKFKKRFALHLPKGKPARLVEFSSEKDWPMFRAAYDLKNYLS